MINKKDRKKISLDGFDYYWKASGDSGQIRLTIIPQKGEGGAIYTTFGYHEEIVPIDD